MGRLGLMLTILVFAVALRLAEAPAQVRIKQQIKSAAPISGWQCPATYPIKGNFTTYSGEPCIYHAPGGQFYDRTKPEMCYASPADAVADGCRASRK